MSTIMTGRYMADVTSALDPDQDSFVVFIIGMRINKLWLPNKWVPVFRAMTPMIRELSQHPELGLLGVRTSFGLTITMIQYWKSFDHLERFAKGDHHLPAWRDFNTKAAASEAVGIYHETFRVHLGDVETIYHNMPVYGLAAATSAVPIGAATASARARIDNSRNGAKSIAE